MKIIRLEVSGEYIARVSGYTGVKLIRIGKGEHFGYIDIVLERVEEPLFYSAQDGDVIPVLEKISLR